MLSKEENQGSNEKIRTNIYATDSVYTVFKTICRREGVSVSVKLEEFMRKYNEAHRPGNPQLQISSYAKPEEQQPMRVQCLFIDGALTDGRVHCRRAGCWVPGVRCYSCEKNNLRNQK